MAGEREQRHVATIRQVPMFSDLSDAEAVALWRMGTCVDGKAGELLIREGEPGDSLFIVLSGVVEITKREGPNEITLAVREAGSVIGEMAILENVPRTASVRIVEAGELLKVGADVFRALLQRMPDVAAKVLLTITRRLRSTEASLVQSDKLASLGTLAAGLAHELNNPAAAIQRSVGYLNAAFEGWRGRTVELNQLDLSDGERRALADLETAVRECAGNRTPDAAARRAEGRLLDRLEEHGVADAWDIAPALASYGWTADRLDETGRRFAPEHIAPVLQWLGAGLAAQQLMEEIQRASQAISEIVKAVKSYAYLDQAPVQDVDLERSLDDTLMILKHKLKEGITVVSDFEPGLPSIAAYAGELNQVWTNIIDNAVQAMEGRGTLEIGARCIGDEVEVTIADSGPGMPDEVAKRIFEPFFTTKAQGVGTGLGLHIAHNIVVNRHKGRIRVETRPGRTAFHIVLPMSLGGAKPTAMTTCTHTDMIHDVTPESEAACRECEALGDSWVHLRVCLTCGHVGCCDSSKNQHAHRHFDASGHPVMQSFEIGEAWRYCFVDEVQLPDGQPFRPG